jgi:hypothetical protein
VLVSATALTCTAHAAGAFDGTYTGQAALMSGDNRSTCKTFATSITVTNDHLTYVHGGGYAIINTDVAADGSFSGSGLLKGSKPPSAEVLKGQVTGSAIDASASGSFCSYHLTLRKAS